MPQIELTRWAMYNLVWSKPMTQVAQDFGISDVALKKICTRHRVPSPVRGYWAKKAAGKPVKMIAFAEINDPQDDRILIFGSNQSALPEAVQKILNEAKSNRTIAPKSTDITVTQPSAAIADIHESVALTAKSLKKAKPKEDGSVSAVGAGMCGIVISQHCVERVIGLLDALAKSLTLRGVELKPIGKGMSVEIDGEIVNFSLSEGVKREKHIPTLEEVAKEERRKKNSSWNFSYQRSYPEWDFIRTSELSLEIENSYLSGFRRSWRDGKRQRLEELIDDISVSIVAYAVGLKIRSEEQEKQRRNWDRQRRLRSRSEARANRENQRAEILTQLVALSAEAERLRTWLKQVKEWPVNIEEIEFAAFVEWSRVRLKFLENAVDASGIGETLKSRNLFPEVDPLVDPPEDLVSE
jgi:hypothetical protein